MRKRKVLKCPCARSDPNGLRGRRDERFKRILGLQKCCYIPVGAVGVEKLGLFTPSGPDIGFTGGHGQSEREEGLLTIHFTHPLSHG